jgi:hypothetical protein
MIPWCFAYDHLNYARYLPAYIADMSHLESQCPEVYQHFVSGGFSVQRGSENPFGKIPADQTIKETVNKDTQTPGGTKGFSIKPAAVDIYYLTAEFRSTFLGQLRESLSKVSVILAAQISIMQIFNNLELPKMRQMYKA